jgi:hypothetical protein
MPPSEEARIHHMANLESAGGSAGAWAGGVTFAATVLVLWGLVLLALGAGLNARWDEAQFGGV